MVAHGDQAIPPEAERQFAARMGAATVEVPTNHVAMVSHPDDVVQQRRRRCWLVTYLWGKPIVASSGGRRAGRR
jgi:hypothetical protein